MSRYKKGGAAARVGLAAVLAAAVLAPGGLGEAAAETTTPALPTIALSFTAPSWTPVGLTDGEWTQEAVTSIIEDRRSRIRVVATASAAVAEQVSVAVTVGAAGGTADKGRGGRGDGDYRTSVDSTTVTIAAGDTSGSSGEIRIYAFDDYLVEGDETIRFTAEAPAGYSAIPAADLVVDDADDHIGLRMFPTRVVEGTAETITVNAGFRGGSSVLAAAADVTVTIASGDGPDGAVLGPSGDFTTDATGNQFTVTIPAGEIIGSVAFTVTAAADTADENFEVGKLTGSASVGGSAVTVNEARIGIVDADLGVGLTVDADADTAGVQSSLGEDAGEVTVRVTASLGSGTAPSGGLTIGVSAWGWDARGRLNERGGALRRVYRGPSSFREGDDYWAIYPSGQSPKPPPGHYLAVRIPQGESSGSADMTVVMNDDRVAEDEETLRFTGGDVTAGGNTYRVVDAQVRLIDNDGATPPPADGGGSNGGAPPADSGGTTPPPAADNEGNGEKPSIVLSLTDGAAVTSVEEGRSKRVRATATASAAVAEQVSVAVTVGAEGSTAVKGNRADYRTSADSTTVTIAAGDTTGSSGYILIDAWEDYLVEGDETIRFTAEAPAGYPAIPAADLVVDDEDNDIDLGVSPSTVVEGTSETVTVTAGFFGAQSALTAATDVTVTVASGGGANGAVLGASGDFTTDAKGNQITVTIPARAVRGSATFTLTAAADTADENLEKGTLTVGSVSFGGSAVAVVDENLVDRTESVPAVTVFGASIGIVDARFGVGLTVDADADTPGTQSSLGEDAGEVTVRVTASLASGAAPPGGLTIGINAWGVDAQGRLNERGGALPRVYEGPSSFRAWDDYWVIYSGQYPQPPLGYHMAIRIPEGESSGSADLTVVMNDDSVPESEEALRFEGGDVTAGGNTYRVVDSRISLIDNDAAPPPNTGSGSRGGAPPAPGDGSGGGSGGGGALPGGGGGSGGGGALPGGGGGSGGGGALPGGGGGSGGGGALPGGGGGSGGGGALPDGGGGSGGVGAAPPDPPAPACVGRFCDEDGSVHQTNTERIAQWQITLGCSAVDPTLFCPSAHITRRQMAAFLYRAVSQRWTIQAPARSELSDVADDAWFRTYADWVISVGAFAAPGGVFNPGGVVTRADMAVMMIAAFPHLEAAAEPEGLFQDAQDADPSVVRAIEGLYRAGVTRGCSTGPLNYCPGQPVTRAQMASYFVRAIDRAPAAQLPAG